jgi:carbamoyl-phosphate synthase large subunit
MERLADLERRMHDAGEGLPDELLVSAKRASFSDRDIGTLTRLGESEVRRRRHAMGLRPGYAMVDTCAAEFAAETPYFYATYAAAGCEPEAAPVPRPACGSAVLGPRGHHVS